MREVQLYIGDDRVELFGGDNISVTDSIRNAKDIAKVFTTFSTQFTVPASKVNNRIFKHYYNYNIDGAYAFDARKKVASRIEIDNLPFKTGRLKLDGVDMRNNAPYAYRITFFGSIVDLKDLLGEDKLPSLTALDIDKDYSPTAIKDALTATGGIAEDGTIIPLITCSQRLYYDSSQNSDQSGNLYYGTVNQGVKFDQLKYAIKITKIIEAIESKYEQITFATESFFKAADQYDFNQLYMWCHRRKGPIDLSLDPIYYPVDGFNPSENVDSTVLKVKSPDDEIVFVDESTTQMDQLFFKATPSSTDAAYDIAIYRNTGSGFTVFQEQRNIIGTVEVQIIDTFVDGTEYYAAIRTYEQDITFSEFEWSANYSGGTDSFLEGTKTFAKSFFFNIADNLPDMKIIDFLSSLFKMFNLVAYVNDKGQIEVQTLDEFYSSEERDISAYIDIEKSQINAALPYKEIIFGYSDTGTLLAQQHYQEIAEVDAATGRGPFEWGAVEYSASDGDLSGSTYKIQPDFHHMKFEKLIDFFNGNDVSVQVGYYVDDNEEDYLGRPLIFYAMTFNPSIALGFLTRTSRLQFGTAAVYYPSNYRLVDDEESESIHFNPEINEYTKTVGDSTLFSRYYQNYIVNLFDAGTRIVKVSAVLPTRILTKLTLADIVVINGEKYRINSYNANLNTGRTELELINKYD
jgi:hypothetical protein